MLGEEVVAKLAVMGVMAPLGQGILSRTDLGERRMALAAAARELEKSWLCRERSGMNLTGLEDPGGHLDANWICSQM